MLARVNFVKIAMNFDLLVGGVHPACLLITMIETEAGFLLHVIKYLRGPLVNLFAFGH